MKNYCGGECSRGPGRRGRSGQLSYVFGLIDVLPWARQEESLDSSEGWPSRPTYSGWLDSPDIATAYGLRDNA